MKVLVCGPYVGEFGWELFFWSGYCRALSRYFEKTIAITRPGHDYLYSDFATVKHFTPPSHGINDCQRNTAVTHDDMETVVHPHLSETTFWLAPFENHHGDHQPHWSQPLYIPAIKGSLVPEYVTRHRPTKITKKCVLIHARNRLSVRPEDNPSRELFDKLTQRLQGQGYEVASVGQGIDSHCIEGTEDQRNISLEQLAHLMDGSICMLGTTSGPLHFASLMGCPVITWQSDVDKMWYRFSTSWNPLNAKLVYINTADEDGLHIHPSPDILIWAVDRIQDQNFRKLQIENSL
jgi:hypothetical protein